MGLTPMSCHCGEWLDGWMDGAKNYQPTPTPSDSDRMIYNSTPTHVTSRQKTKQYRQQQQNFQTRCYSTWSSLRFVSIITPDRLIPLNRRHTGTWYLIETLVLSNMCKLKRVFHMWRFLTRLNRCLHLFAGALHFHSTLVRRTL